MNKKKITSQNKVFGIKSNPPIHNSSSNIHNSPFTIHNSLVPRLRFPEFRDAGEWEEYSGDTLFEQVNDKNLELGLPVLAITQEHGAIPRDMIDYHVSVTEKSIESYKVVQVGDFIISLRSFQGGIEYSQYHGICSPAYVILRRRIDGSDAYFKHYLKTDRFIHLLTKNLEGLRDGKMISYKKFSALQLPVPTLPEQQKIADCLSSLDGLIAAESENLDALKTHKKGLMQRLFPRVGETVPRLRFPEFRDAGAWEESTLGQCLSRHPEYGINAPAVAHAANLPTYLRITDISDDGQIRQDQKVSVAKDVTDENYLEEGDIVLARTGASVGKSYKYRTNDGRLVFAGFLIRVRPNKQKLNAEFLFQFLSTEKYWRWVNFSSARSGQPGINGNEYASLPVQLPPCLEEQQIIADCLSSLDGLIAAESEKLDALKTHKKGLMQQLFPAVEESTPL